MAQVDGRHIDARLEERKKARDAHLAAIEAGKVAAIAEEGRPKPVAW